MTIGTRTKSEKDEAQRKIRQSIKIETLMSDSNFRIAEMRNKTDRVQGYINLTKSTLKKQSEMRKNLNISKNKRNNPKFTN